MNHPNTMVMHAYNSLDPLVRRARVGSERFVSDLQLDEIDHNRFV